jgi:hypothetical protein
MPSSPNYKRNYKQEYAQKGQSSKAAIKKRGLRVKARRAAIAAGKAKKGDGRDVGHKRALSKGGSGKLSNTKIQSRKSNRSAGGRMGSKAGKAAGARKGHTSRRKK